MKGIDYRFCSVDTSH